MPTVAVIGGGFGGVYAIKRLQSSFRDIKIILFEPSDRFVFTPLLHEVAADVLHVPAVTHEYKRIFQKCVRHIMQRAVQVDLEKKSVTGEDGKNYRFDYVIIAPGSKTRLLHANMGVDELKHVKDALSIRRKVEENVSMAAERCDEGGAPGKLLECIIVGGGPTGIELSAELVDFYKHRLKKENLDRPPKVTVLQSGPSILKGVSPDIQRSATKFLTKKGIRIVTQSRVQGVEKGEITATTNGVQKKFRAGCIVWTAGVVPNEIALPGVQKQRGYIPVTETLQLQRYPFAFAIGDASVVTAAPYPALAQVAVQQGVMTGKNILRLIGRKRPRKFFYHNKGFLMSLGQKYGVGKAYGTFIQGFFAWFIWRTVYLAKFVGVRSKMRLMTEYTLRLFGRRDAPLRKGNKPLNT